MTTKTIANSHGIRDNHGRGKVADFLTERISDGSVLSVVSAYFTIYAYQGAQMTGKHDDTLAEILLHQTGDGVSFGC